MGNTATLDNFYLTFRTLGLRSLEEESGVFFFLIKKLSVFIDISGKRNFEWP